MKPSFDLYFMRMAYVTAQRASCPRKHVGALIVDGDHRIVASGYNGAPRGLPDCLEIGCDLRTLDGREGCVRTLHSESNAIDYAGRRAEGCMIYITCAPCRACSMRILQAGIFRVVYHEHYESTGTTEALDMLRGRISVERLDQPMPVVNGAFQEWAPLVGPEF